MKKNLNSKTIYYVAIVLLLIALIGSLVANTYARYATQVTGEATATAAAWSFTANGLGSVETPIKLADTMTGSYPNLKTGTIAPGTSGSFTVTVDGTGSETGIKYSIALTSSTGDNSNLPSGLKISIGEATKTTEVGYIAYNAAPESMKKTFNVVWNWTLGDNESDTNYDTNLVTGANNLEAGETYTLKVVITAEQFTGAIS